MEIVAMDTPVIKETLVRPIPQDLSPKVSKKSVEEKEPDLAAALSIKEITMEQEEAARKIAESLTEFVKSIGYSLQFIPDREAGLVVIKVLDGEGNLVRQIPPEAIRFLSSKIGESIGILLNSKL